MSMRGWLRRRRRRPRRRQQGEAAGSLREFVYLDEVSVYSLMASQVGLIVTELTETQASSLQSEVSSGIGIAAPFKAEVGSKVQGSESSSSQILRKAIIQTTFRDLRESAERSGALRLAVTTEPPPSVSSLDDVRALGRSDSRSPWVVSPESLKRGELVEMDVHLEAEPIYQADAVMSGLLEIVQDDPAAFGVKDLSELAQARLMSRMLDKVLAGLVPLRGRAVQYDAVDVDGESWLIHSDVVTQLQTPISRVPVYLVGVAQEALFWKDVRRVLFSGSCYRVLARLNADGLRPSWTPVKLVDVLRDVMPDFADVMDAMNKGVIAAMSSAVSAQQSLTAQDRVGALVTEYASLLSERTGVEVDPKEVVIGGDFGVGPGGLPSVHEIRKALAPITRLVEERSGQKLDRDVAADYRVAAIARAGLFDASSTNVPPVVAADEERDERFLDSEIVAIYW